MHLLFPGGAKIGKKVGSAETYKFSSPKWLPNGLKLDSNRTKNGFPNRLKLIQS